MVSGETNIMEKLKIYGIILSVVILIVLIWLIVLTIIVVQEEQQLIPLYINNGANNTMKATNTSSVLYSYHTRNTSSILKSYDGHFLVTHSPIGSVNFTVTNEKGENITGNISNPDYTNLPTKVEFKSSNPTSLAILNYTSNKDFNLERLEIMI